jgi:serine/threonine protein kinase
MSLLDWNGIEAAFAAMAPLPTEEREAAVRGSALTSAELDELRTLLAAHDSERRIPRLYPSGLEPGDIVGAYRIRAAIGRGGMGTVHLADRIYGFSQRVAIKTINSASPAAIQRFETERRALAGLGHPNIVSLIDAGVGPGNVPYLVMEHVEGLPITEHCRAQHLTLSARLRLLARVAGAVHHAHLRGVLHRDLKPSNVLVTQDGAPKILDFGIAKVLDSSGPPGGGTASARTVPLTLNYASPEQIRALTATERSDVFGLGIVAYEAIAGVRPRELEGLPLDDVLALALAAPAPPSTRAAGATPAYAACALPPEVDEVILRAISVNPDDRHQSAIALKEDLERLATEVEVQSAHCAPAVTPRPEFRRRSVVAGMAAAALLLVAAAGLSSWWPNRPGNARVVLPLEESSPAQTPLVPDATHTDTDPAAGRPELVPEELNPDRGTMAEQADSLRDQATAAPCGRLRLSP